MIRRDLIPDLADARRLEQLRISSGAENWKELALALARRFHPEFAEPISVGRPKKWGDLQRMALVGEVAIVMSELGCTSREACRILASEQHWKDFLARSNRPRAKRLAAPVAVDHSAALYEQLKPAYTTAAILQAVEVELGELIDANHGEEWSVFVRAALGLTMENK